MNPAVPSGSAGQPAVHTLTSTLSAGTFTIGPLDGSTTAPLGIAASGAAALTGAEVARAINQALSQGAAISGTGPAGGPWVITVPTNLIGPLAANEAFSITLTGATGTVVDAVTTEGIPGGNELAGSGMPASEPPHIVGASGQVAYAASFESPFGKSLTVKFPSAAAAASSNLQPAQFYMDQDGFVHVEGHANPTGALTAGKLIFTLPAGYRPFQDEDFGMITVKANGEVISNTATSAANEALALEAVSFRPVGI